MAVVKGLGVVETEKMEEERDMREKEKKKGGRGGRGALWWLSAPFYLIFRLFTRASDINLEQKLQHLSKEEVTIHKRMTRRITYWRKMAQSLILYSILIEVLLLAFAIIFAQSPSLKWRERSLRVLPTFVFPLLATFLYSCGSRITRHRDSKDKLLLEKLRAERQAKIEELKEKTNYYLTQQLIQRYDTDPTAKAAAASILVSKMGAEAGVKATVELHRAAPAKGRLGSGAGEVASGVSLPGEVDMQDGHGGAGLRRRRGGLLERGGEGGGHPQRIGTGWGSGERVGAEGLSGSQGALQVGGGEDEHEGEEMGGEGESVGGWRRGGGGGRRGAQGGRVSEGGWAARLAAMLVGEDPTQCYALICLKCHAHNGLATKEDFPYMTYRCPHCGHLNVSLHHPERAAASSALPPPPSPSPSPSPSHHSPPPPIPPPSTDNAAPEPLGKAQSEENS